MTSLRSIAIGFIILLLIIIVILAIYSLTGFVGALLFISISMFAASAIDLNAGSPSRPYDSYKS